MHNSRKVFLLEDDKEPRCILAAYETGETAHTTEFKTFDQSIKVDDYILVPSGTRHRMTVCKVHSIDVEPTLDTDEKIDWVVGTIDQSNYQDTIEQEQVFIDAVKSAEKAALKKKLREDFLANVDTSGMGIIEHQSTSE